MAVISVVFRLQTLRECVYQASTKTLTMIPYSQINGKITSTETVRVASCVCKEETANEKFRFIVAGEEIQNPVRRS